MGFATHTPVSFAVVLPPQPLSLSPLPQFLLLLSPIEQILTKDATGIIATWRIWHVNIEILILSSLTSHRIESHTAMESNEKCNVHIK